jgi:hypothetical protein
MSKVRLGPFSKIHISLLQQKLEKENISSEIYEDLDLLREFAQKARSQKIVSYPTFSGAAEYIYLEIEKEYLLLIKQDLDKMGFPPVRAEAPPEGEDYFCPSCKFSSSAPGVCPVHQLRLLDFSNWIESKDQRRNKISKLLYQAALLVLLFLLGAVLRSWLGAPKGF